MKQSILFPLLSLLVCSSVSIQPRANNTHKLLSLTLFCFVLFQIAMPLVVLKAVPTSKVNLGLYLWERDQDTARYFDIIQTN